MGKKGEERRVTPGWAHVGSIARKSSALGPSQSDGRKSYHHDHSAASASGV